MVVKPVLKEGKTSHPPSSLVQCLASFAPCKPSTKHCQCLSSNWGFLVFQLDGSMKEGPWSFRIAYLCTTLPLYSCVLLTVATIAGRRPYFKKVVLRMWGRFLPKKALARFQ